MNISSSSLKFTSVVKLSLDSMDALEVNLLEVSVGGFPNTSGPCPCL